jgi:hypothetical protein
MGLEAGSAPRAGDDRVLHAEFPRQRERRACSCGSAPWASKRCFHNAIVRELQPVLAVIVAYVSPSASDKMTRARRAASARPLRDRSRVSNAVRGSLVSANFVDGVPIARFIRRQYKPLVSFVRLRCFVASFEIRFLCPLRSRVLRHAWLKEIALPEQDFIVPEHTH